MVVYDYDDDGDRLLPPSPRPHALDDLAEPPLRRPRDAEATPRRRLIAMFSLVGVAVALVLTVLRAQDHSHSVASPSSQSASQSTAGGGAKKSMTYASHAYTHHFATKTKYWDQRKAGGGGHHRDRRRLQFHHHEPMAPHEDLSDHRLLQTHVIARHGIRYPTLGSIHAMRAFLAKLEPLQSELPGWLRNYTLPYEDAQEGELAAAGIEEMRKFAERTVVQVTNANASASDAVRPTFTPEQFEVAHTHVRRTRDSAHAFANAFFANPSDVQFSEYAKDKDLLLRFFDHCPRYDREVKSNATAIHEVTKFTTSKMMEANGETLLRFLNVTHRRHELDITPEDLTAVYEACAFDIAVADIRDHWCLLLNPTFVHSMDYFEDLKAFYQLAGGYPINYEMASVLLRDVVAGMDQRANGSSALVGRFRFAHAETTLPLMTLLGYGSRAPLLANVAKSTMKVRGFRTSLLAPFAANIAFRLYEDAAGAHFVQVVVNELADIVLPGCEPHLHCPLDQAKRLWARYLVDFDLARACT